MKSLHAAMLGPTFWAWRTVAKFLDGMPLEPSELELFQQITSRRHLP
jgi:hypothetical protein